LLAELARAHLVDEHTPGRFACHDLLRAYAAELAQKLETEPDRAAAVRRMLDHYLHSGHSADRLLNPHPDDDVPPPGPAVPGIVVEFPAGRAQAVAWFAAEQAVLTTVIRKVTGFDPELWQLVQTLRRYLAYQGLWYDLIDLLGTALEAARRLSDPLRQAFAHRFLGYSCVAVGRFDQAEADLRRAAELYAGEGSLTGQAHVHRHFAWMFERLGRHDDAIRHARRALDLFVAAGHPAGQARALNAIGWFNAVLGDHEAALRHCLRALRLQEEVGDRFGQAETWDSLGYAHRHLGRLEQAVECYRIAVELYREFDDRYNEADSLVSLGDVLVEAGDPASARVVWREALGIMERLGHSEAHDVRVRLMAPG
jgi:tetratricopeptide (TPR) repeat protein